MAAGAAARRLDLILLGDPAVGKTALRERLTTDRYAPKEEVEEQPSSAYPQNPCGKRSVALESGDQVLVNVWDPLAMADFASANTSLAKQVRGFALIFDLGSEETLNNIPKWARYANKQVTDQKRDTAGVLFVMIGHKADAPSVVSDDAITKVREQIQRELFFKPEYFKVSSVTGEGAAEMLLTSTTIMDDLQRQNDGKILMCSLWMLKRGAINKSFRRRLFKFYSNGDVEYFKTPEGPPRGTFTLEGGSFFAHSMCEGIAWPKPNDRDLPENLLFGIKAGGGDRIYYIACYDESLVTSATSYSTLESVLRRFKFL